MVWALTSCACIKSYTVTDKDGNEVKVIEAMGLGNVKGKIEDRSIEFKPIPIPENLPVTLEP